MQNTCSPFRTSIAFYRLLFRVITTAVLSRTAFTPGVFAARSFTKYTTYDADGLRFGAGPQLAGVRTTQRRKPAGAVS